MMCGPDNSADGPLAALEDPAVLLDMAVASKVEDRSRVYKMLDKIGMYAGTSKTWLVTQFKKIYDGGGGLTIKTPESFGSISVGIFKILRNKLRNEQI